MTKRLWLLTWLAESERRNVITTPHLGTIDKSWITRECVNMQEVEDFHGDVGLYLIREDIDGLQMSFYAGFQGITHQGTYYRI